jgi:FkbM family methyltransferase
MTRKYVLNRLSFAGVHVMMESFIDDWGEDDSLIGDAAERGYDENMSLAMWAYAAASAPTESIMIDVGAYAGIYTLFACKIRPTLKICAFEASAITYGRLTKNIFLNSLETRVAPANLAAWRTAEIIRMDHRYGIYSKCAGDSVVMEFDGVDHTVNVSAVPLDALLSAPQDLPDVFASKAFALPLNPAIAAVKIDIEGAEIEALAGAATMLKMKRPIIICEVLTDATLASLELVMGPFDYEVSRIADERNFLLCPRENRKAFTEGFESWKDEHDGTLSVSIERELILNIR